MTAGRYLLTSFRWPGARTKEAKEDRGDKERQEKSVRGEQISFSLISSMLISSLDFPKFQAGKVVKISWRIKDFMEKMTNCGDAGINSKSIKIRLNDVTTAWNASLRFWTNEDGEKIFNPFLFCCNLVSVHGKTGTAGQVGLGVEVRLREATENPLLSHLLTDVPLQPGAPLRSVAASSVTLDEKFLQAAGDVVFQVKLTFSGSACPAREPHLAGCVDTADLILHCGAGQLQAHKHKLAAVSGVFATMIKDNSQARLDHNNNNNNNNNNDKNTNILAGTKDRIVVQGVELEILRKILAFIYTGDTKDFAAHCVKLLKAAHLYQIVSLKAECENMLTSQLSPEKVSTILLVADMTCSQQLKQSALKYCVLYKEYIYKDSTWQKMEAERPWLYSEAVGSVAPSSCRDHLACVRASNRYRDLVSRGADSTNSCDT